MEEKLFDFAVVLKRKPHIDNRKRKKKTRRQATSVSEQKVLPIKQFPAY
jgi:hypothetical protein